MKKLYILHMNAGACASAYGTCCAYVCRLRVASAEGGDRECRAVVCNAYCWTKDFVTAVTNAAGGSIRLVLVVQLYECEDGAAPTE